MTSNYKLNFKNSKFKKIFFSTRHKLSIFIFRFKLEIIVYEIKFNIKKILSFKLLINSLVYLYKQKNYYP